MIAYVIAWLLFIRSGPLPIGVGLKKSDWLVFCAVIITLFGTFLLGLISYIQNVSLQKSNERFAEANLKLLE